MRRAVETIWGDGFDEDGWAELARVDDWACCSPDEYLRIFPQLVPRDRVLPLVLWTHLEDCVAARAWRLRFVGEISALRSLDADKVETLGPQVCASWFSRRADVRWTLRGGGIADDDLAAELDGLRFVDDMLRAVIDTTVPAFDESLATSFAFCTGIHPVYLWPEAVLAHQLHTAAAWLGHVGRGRRAYMPSDIAEYFLGVIVGEPPHELQVCDPRIAFFLDRPLAVEELWRVASMRSRGRAVPTRRPIDARMPRLAGRLPEWPRGLARPDPIPLDRSGRRTS